MKNCSVTNNFVGTPSWSGLLAIVFLFVASGTPTAASIWQDEDFLDRFTATFGVRGTHEPQVTRAEQELLREVATHMPENPGEAVAVLEGRLSSDSSAALDFTLANLRFQLDEFTEATAHYRAAVHKFPDFLRAHKNLGLVLARQDQYGDALTSLTRALTLGSADSDTYGLIGFAHLQREHWVSAEAAYRQALLFEPENANWQVGLAQALQHQERHGEAGALLAELTSRHPERADYWMYQANTYIANGQPEDAAANLEFVRRMERIGQDGLLLLGDIYVNDDLASLALGAYEEAFQDGARVPFRRSVRAAERLSQAGHITEASRLTTWIERDLPAELSPDEESQLRRLQARLAMADERTADAQGLLEQALEADPRDGESLLLLAELTAPSDLERAEVLLEQAARLSGTAAQALRQHGELLVREGRYGDAIPLLREAYSRRSGEALRRYIERVENLVESAGD